jgi:hypothetical protein
MNAIRNGNQLSIVLAAALALTACNQTPPPPPPPPKPAPTAPTPAPTPAPTAAAPAPTTAGTTFVSVDLGNGVNSSGNALTGAPMTTFAPKDTIYALVKTSSGSATPATISAKWTFNGSTLVNENKHEVAAAGDSTTEFHIAKPDGWPTGKYSVAISINGQQVGSKDFEVK